ncbi:CorA family divalent cation transporter [Albibacterium sp.]|uniref:CorA family divalent cation transporter n=1 Tax=Albibacterium sp. TaxID=2952885 RepID=UPI002C4284A4|nr:CorA family divalent cation transporter [Albibacterium sp.]HUH19583.1 CorA family divalent cation transporter [Albibacterium sp.]
MAIVDLSKESQSFKWIDVSNPSEAEIKQISKQFKLHKYTLRDCLQPDHLPKNENLGNMQFAITRILLNDIPVESHTVQGISSKVAIFYNADLVVTVHRIKQPFLKKIFEASSYDSSVELVTNINWYILQSYENTVTSLSEHIDKYEEMIFLKPLTKEILKDLYLIRRKASVCMRLVLLTKEVINKIPIENNDIVVLQDLKDLHLKLSTLFEQAHEDSTHLLDIYLSLSSKNSNEVMKVLTIFSVFLLPPTFIVGLYGMNFDFMPELHYKWSYPAVIIVILAITVIIYLWFKRKKWL